MAASTEKSELVSGFVALSTEELVQVNGGRGSKDSSSSSCSCGCTCNSSENSQENSSKNSTSYTDSITASGEFSSDGQNPPSGSGKIEVSYTQSGQK